MVDLKWFLAWLTHVRLMQVMSDSEDEHLDMDTEASEDIVQEPVSPPPDAVPVMHHLSQVR